MDGKLTTPKDAEGESIFTQAREVVSELRTQATEVVASKVTKRQEQSALELNGLAETLRQKGEELEGSVLGPLVGRAADQMDRASEFLMDANLSDVMRSTERFARREPLLFIGGAFTLGLLAARFLKSSSHHAIDASADQSGAPVRP